MLSGLRKLSIEILPPFISDRDRQLRFQTTDRFAGLQERKFLFLTSSGPVEIAFRPLRALMLGASFISASALSVWAMLSLPALIPENMPQMPQLQLSSMVSTLFSVPSASRPDNMFSMDTIDDSDAAQPARTSIARSTVFSSTGQDSEAEMPAEIPSVIAGAADTEKQLFEALPKDPAIQDQQLIANMAASPAQPQDLANEQKLFQATEASAQPLSEFSEMEPEFIDFDGLANPPVRTPDIRFHQQFHFMLTEAEIIEDIVSHFNITLDDPPPAFTGQLTGNKEDLTPLYLHRDNWRKTLAKLPLKPPLRYYYVTSPYGWRTHPKTGKRLFHHGIDLAGTWRSQIQVPTPGIVIFAGTDGGYGKTVRVDHGNGVVTVYAHLTSISVRTGDYVTPEISLGKMGNTGHSDGMHLHYEVRIDGKSVDPALMFEISHQIGVLGNVPSDISY